ncbi:MAG: conjugal transfer protein MobC [Agriterribacter sp.]
MQTGENDQGLKKVMDMTRLMAVTMLLIHVYFYCYGAFSQWELTSKLTDNLLKGIVRTGLFSNIWKSKLIALGFLFISVLGVKGKKSETINYKRAIVLTGAGLLIYNASALILQLPSHEIKWIATAYMIFSLSGFIITVKGTGLLSRIIKDKLSPATFNKHNETFPQEERLIKNEYSINLPAKYHYKNKWRKSWINFINPMRGLLVIGSPGSGKSYFIIENIIRQHIEKGYSMFIYDFKFDDLTRLAYNHLLKHGEKYAVKPAFRIINFELIFDRCNPLNPDEMHDITDAVEAAKIIMLGLNRSWLKKQGEFFVESPINFVIALIWFLRKYNNGRYCTLPHVIELMQVPIEKLFTILRTEPEIEVYVNPFISALETGSLEQLEGQLDAAKISLARLSSPAIYYVMTGNDFSLDINNQQSPSILCLANNPQKQDVFGAVLSLYIARMTKIINRKNQLKCSIIMDEFTTLTFLGLDTLIATGRSNKIATTIAIQDASQLKLNYGRELAEVIVNICGNIISGQVSGEIAKQLSERLGKILQERESISVNSNDSSFSRSKQLEFAVPVSTISSLSSGEFVGMIADNPDEPIALKGFHANIVNDHKGIEVEKENFKSPSPKKAVNSKELLDVYEIVKLDVAELVESSMEEILNDPAKQHLIIKQK